MKTCFHIFTSVTLACAFPVMAQEQPATPLPTATAGAARGGDSSRAAQDLATILDGQEQALDQARQLLAQDENVRNRAALESAVKEMERARAALEQAAKAPARLTEALAAEQAAYQALLKATPREFRITRSRNNSQNGGAGQPGPRELNQLDLQREENRYETERQAMAPPSARQRDQLHAADRLKELAQRQQDVNERLRELQTALQAARTDSEREELERQLKRLRDDEQKLLADVDDLQQQLDRSPAANSLAEARQQLEQTRSDMERAAREMERDSASQALASATRAQQNMQNLREDLRRQTSSEFSDQMRQLRTQARELARQEEDVARQLDSLQNGEQKSLNDSAPRQQLADQLARQQSALTNLLGGMRSVTEQAENTEPLLSKQLYDSLRRADQMHTDNLLEMSSQLASRGFFPQASEAERSARTNINELRQSVERAAESVLGNEADALRYAQSELANLARQVEREVAAQTTNSSSTASLPGATNRLAQGSGQGPTTNAPGGIDTNSLTAALGPPGNDSNQRQASSSSGQRGDNGESARQTGPGTEPGRQADANRPGSNRSRLANGNSPAGSGESSNGEATDSAGGGSSGGARGPDRLRQLVEQLGGADRRGGGPITGNGYVDWSDRLRDVERVLDPEDLRNQLASVRERMARFRADYRNLGRLPDTDALERQVLAPMTQVRVWLQQELARQANARSLVPLDRDPVPENYSEAVRQYYEKLGSAQ